MNSIQHTGPDGKHSSQREKIPGWKMGAMSEEGIFGERFSYVGHGSNKNTMHMDRVLTHYLTHLKNSKPADVKSGLFIPKIQMCWTPASLKSGKAKSQEGDEVVIGNGENATPPKREFSYKYEPSSEFHWPKQK